MILKLFIIPWIWARAQNVQSNPAAVAPPPTAPNAQFVDIPFYQFLQRQNQINNAILLNNAMLANSLTAIPPNEHQMQIANTLQFPNAAVALPANHAALFPNFQPKLAAVPTAGLNRLGIYDVLNRPVKFEPMSNMLVPAQVSSSTTTQAPPTKKTTVLPESEGSNKEEIQEPDPIPIGVSEPDDITKKVIDLSVASRQKATTRTTEIPSLTELIEEIGEENLITTTTEKAIDVISTKKPKPDVYNILKTLNLTDEETNDLVSHVEKVVREELVRKLSEARIIDRTTTTEKLATTVPTTEAVTTTAESEEFEEPIKIPLRRTKPEKELLFYIPQKKPKAEIKHHPQRLSAEERPEFVEAEILTSQMHLPIQEKIEDEKNDEDAVETTGKFHF
ncbi:hypothetical protein RB195_009409 [Necator americanus]|uniref:Uncharacterized protein n=1 Tax=Necator americanus TaxID=51031 RepID=A0ABR1CT69_NECAM